MVQANAEMAASHGEPREAKSMVLSAQTAAQGINIQR